MTDRPSFDELAGGDDLSPEEAARLQRVHNLLIEAGPPPELPPHLQEPDPEGGRRDNVVGLPRRRTGMLLGIAAALVLTAFLGGFVYGTRHAPFNEDFSVPMHSTAAGSPAKAVIHVGKIDSAGNWPLKVDVENLPELPKGQYYEMFLSRGADKRAASCGTFRVSGSTDDFYVPEPEDVRSQVGKPGAYSFEPVSDELAETTREQLRAVYETAFGTYEQLVELGVARELARSVLPVGAYTEFYWTVNARSLMNFLSLRNSETAQREIRRYAEACERFLEEKMPVTYAAFVANDRTAP